MTRRNSNADTVVKFPIGRVVREHRIGGTRHGSPELDAIEHRQSRSGGRSKPCGGRKRP
jgi:hypothetical protein